IYGRQGVELSRSLLSGWVDACCRQLSPLEEALHGYVLTDGKLHADDTPVPVLLPGNKKTKTGRLWTCVRDDRNAGSTLAPAVWFAYSPDRKGIHPQTHLAGFSGVLQADAYAGFNELYRDGRITEAACWAHARRKIHDVHVRTPSALTEEALKRIGELYAIEAEIRGMTAEQRLAERQLKTKPLLKSLESWLREKMKTLSRHSELAKAFAYALNQWPALTYYADDGWAEADNNIAENALRMVSLGRKNYLFFGSDHGGERGALLYSLIGTCKLNGVDPFLIMHGSKDTLVSPEQSAKLFRMLKKNGDNAEYVLVEGAEHGDKTWYQPIIINRVVEWFTKNLGAPIKTAPQQQNP
uniref:IS66 family transposase n=1 Tax=Escherichia coli TaxID=562 RepID=UPI001BFF2BC2